MVRFLLQVRCRSLSFRYSQSTPKRVAWQWSHVSVHGVSTEYKDIGSRVIPREPPTRLRVNIAWSFVWARETSSVGM